MIQVGKSGNNFMLSFSRNALMAMREGKSFPIQLQRGEENITFIAMLDVEVRKHLKALSMINSKSEETANIRMEVEEETAALTKSLADKSKLDI